MSENELSVDHRILIVMRKVLTQIIKETATAPGMRHPLSDECIRDIRDCLGLISARDAELTEARGAERSARPHYTDEPKTSRVVTLEPAGPKKQDPE